MNREVRVILGVAIHGFVSGLNSARSAWLGFTNGIKGGVQQTLADFGHLGDILQWLGGAFRDVTSVVKSLFDTFVSGVAAQQRLESQFYRLVGSGQDAKAMLKEIGDENTRLGFVTDDMLPSINQFATALKAMDGEVKPERLQQMVDMMRRIKAARPDLGTEEVTRAILQAARGDVERIKMLLGVGLDDVTGLSDKAQKTMAALKATGDQQLGEVTKIAGGMKPSTQDLLDLFDEYLNKLGMTQQATEDTKNDWERNVARMTDIWDEFKDTLGAPILATLNEELTKLGEWFKDHKEEINEFAKKFGEFTAEGIEHLLDALMNVDWERVAKAGTDFAEAFSKVDWATIGKIIENITKLTGAAAKGNAIDLATTAFNIATNNQVVLPTSNTSSGFSPGQSAPGHPQNVHVTVSVDGEGNIKAAVRDESERAANKAIGNLVEQTTQKHSGGTGGKR